MMEADERSGENVIEEKIIRRVIDHEMKKSYMAYSMSVIVSRALPDVRDGLKPVHRRVLYTMWENGLLHNKPYKKSANVVGNCMAKYHPHGDSPIYYTLVRLAQDFSMRYLLVQGQGNFGSIDGDSPAAMRYTEARLRKLAEEMLQDIEKNTVDFVDNFDGSAKEPTVLPSKIPNLLINGSSGIAVGMATNIPPHNLREVCEGAIKIIENPELSDQELFETIKGPDFPTGSTIIGRKGIIDAYKTGKGKIKVRAKIEREDSSTKEKLIIKEIPYMVNKAHLIEHIANLVNEKRIQGITDIRDESDQKNSIRVVLELKKGANSDVIINQLYAHTRLQETFGTIMLALVDNEPKILTLRSILKEYIKHRETIVTRRTQYELDKAEARAHIIEGLVTALDHIDKIIAFLKKSKSTDSAKAGLMIDYGFSEKQAQAILDMKLQKLTSLEQDKLRSEFEELKETIKKLKQILSDINEIYLIIKEELKEMIEKYGDERKTQISGEELETIDDEELIKSEDCVVTMTHAGYVKRLPQDTYKAQKRGGRGIIAAETKEEDIITNLFSANTHDYLLFFTNKGKIHWLKVYKIPESGRYAKGTSIVNLLDLEKDEKITASMPIQKFEEDKYIFMVTKKGIVKKTSLSLFSSPRKGGIKAIGSGEDDSLVNAFITNGQDNIIIATKKGMAAKFNEEDVRPMGRTAYGVRGIKLKKDDFVIGAVVAEKGKTLLTVTEYGYGKRTDLEDYRLISRGGVGVINIKITEKNSGVVGICVVDDADELMFITQSGILLRMKSKEISVIGRSTQGVRIMRLSQGDKLINLAKIQEQ